jgi:SAM-dependent methyltransferase
MTKRPTSELAQILSDCKSLARGVRLEDQTAILAKLLTFEPNLDTPVHRWYKFKEGFSQGLVAYLLSQFPPNSAKTVRFLDPFCGVGTSLLSAETALDAAGVRQSAVRGVEVNPYMHFVTKTKMNWRRYDPVFMLRAADIAANGFRLRKRPQVPTLSTLNNTRFVDPNALRRILELRDKLILVAKGRTELQPLLLGLAAATERVFNLRKDGRALRFVARAGITVDEAVEQSWSTIAEDLQLNRISAGADWAVVRGDGRRSDLIFKGEQFDVILFSPPYLNNIDYTEVYKVEQWLLGFLNSGQQMTSQRRRTFRSHPSCTFPEYNDARFERVAKILGAPFCRLVEYASVDESWRRRLFLGYFSDMLRTLESCRRLLKPRGRIFLILGNSVHGTAERPIPIAADLWTAKLATAADLRVESILIGRRLPRRRMDWEGFRESVLVISR